LKSTGRNDPEKVFRAQLHTVVRNLERAVDDLLQNFWEEPLRRHAHELASALLASCKTYGYLELGSVTRAIHSLVALPREEAENLQQPLKDKLKELLGLLREMAAILAA